jgi:histidinol-phosphate phosphatase family protein
MDWRSQRAEFIDRDGVINRAVLRNGHPAPPSTLDELDLLPSVAEALEALHREGFLLIVATNQPDVATGVQRAEIVESIHERLRRALPIDDIKVCYHVDRNGCACRKPKPGMLLEAAREWSWASPIRSWWAIGGETSGRAGRRGVQRFWSGQDTGSGKRYDPTSWSTPCSRRAC